MGRVYAVEHPHGPLAVKLLHEVLAGDPDMVDRMVGEARAGRRVCHPNVVKIVDQGSVRGGIPFVAMERAGGAPLGIVVQRDGGLPLSRIAAIAMQLLAGLAAIHRALLVHADMKSDNILVDAAHGDRATIIDFGLARAPHASPHRADPKLVSGTPEYMAPELIRGDAVTVAADLYAVGIILYELLTGTTPFCGGTTAEIFERQLRDEVVPPSLRSPDRTIPPALEAVVMRALHKEPAVRFGDAAAMAAAIARALPASCADDTAAPPSRCAASASSPTCDWSRRTQVHRRRRLADGTAPHENGARKAIVARRRTSRRGERRRRSRRDRRRVHRARGRAHHGAPAARRGARARDDARDVRRARPRSDDDVVPAALARGAVRRARRSGAGALLGGRRRRRRPRGTE
ncbi:MAG: serine/threonine protein kinase [Deltaproteobacteria bacterium]|nr:serine/threonine protein kinase [Deltaproteobacteria bacterium]